MLRIIYGENNEILQRIDTRVLTEVKVERILAEKHKVSEAILSAYPQHRQQNAALGLYSEEEVLVIKNGIQAFRDQFAARETAINECATLNELDSLYHGEYT